MKNNSNTKDNQASETVEVLYQKMGDRWFAFSMIEDEVFVGSLTEDEIQGKTSQKEKTFKISGRS